MGRSYDKGKDFSRAEIGLPASTGVLVETDAKQIGLALETSDDSLGHDIAMREIAARGLRYCVSANWETDVVVEESHLADMGVPLFYRRSYMDPKTFKNSSKRWERFTWINDEIIIDIVSRDAGASTFTCYTDDYDIGVKWLIGLHDVYKPITAEGDEHIIDLHFWSLASNGPNLIRRKIAVPKWDEIAPNYSYETYTGLSKMLAKDFRPESLVTGQLLLWYGPPGTGKTYAIRALANEWRDWCDFEYVVDPEKFFGAEASYLMNVIIGSERYSPLDDDEGESEPDKRWRTLIFEDTGELLSADAKERSGQGLSRLLNLVDGLIGQGLRILVLITTNEDIGRFHPAVARPGRISASIRFSELNATESAQWAAEHDLTIEKRSHTIAELFDQSKGSAIRAEPEQVQAGFRLREPS